MYITDTNNQRVVHLDENLSALKIITKPADALMDELSEFLPLKVVADNAERVYLLARNVNKGIMEFDASGAFTGYIGANKVNFDVVDMIWKTLSTRAQREQMMLFVPTEYSNITLDHKGFFYTTCNTFTEEDLMNISFSSPEQSTIDMLFGIGTSSNVEPIRRLNAMGEDILIRNGWVTPLGDWDWGTTADISGPSRMVDIATNEENSYFALDRTRGRIFGYDFQGNLLFVFGGVGNKAGYFQFPTAIEHMEGKLLVMDATAGSMTIFEPTEYGALIHEALAEYVKGNYEYSAELWDQVLVYNANFDLAYIGLGRALLRQDKYEEAMYYFRLKNDRLNYSKAYQQYRKQMVEDNIAYIVIVIVGLIVGWNVYKQVRKFRRGTSHVAEETA
jgi:hypothetical protein